MDNPQPNPKDPLPFRGMMVYGCCSQTKWQWVEWDLEVVVVVVVVVVVIPLSSSSHHHHLLVGLSA
jgi:hypothetical protein